MRPKWQKKRVFCDSDVLKNVLKFHFFFCPENKNFVCPGLQIPSTEATARAQCTQQVCLFGRTSDHSGTPCVCVQMVMLSWRTVRKSMMTRRRAWLTATPSFTQCSFSLLSTSWWPWHTGTSKWCDRLFSFCFTSLLTYSLTLYLS